MDTILGILGLLIAIGLSLIPYFRKVYFVGPELTIELFSDVKTSSSKGISSKNDRSNGYIDANSAIYIFELVWHIKIRITNNSNLTAYYPVFIFFNPQNCFTSIDKLDQNTPIQENEKIVLNCTFKTSEECEGKDRTKMDGLPKHLKDLIIILEYKNSYKKTFYTIYSQSMIEKHNKYCRRIPKDFKLTNHTA